MIRLLQHKPDENYIGFVIRQDSVRETYQLHCHDFYEFFLVTKGRALHIVNDTVQTVSRGSLVFVRPDDAHCYDSVSYTHLRAVFDHRHQLTVAEGYAVL